MAISKRGKQELEQCYSDHKELGGEKKIISLFFTL